MRGVRDNYRDRLTHRDRLARGVPTESDWLAEAHHQLDCFEGVTRAELESLDHPPTGDQAARRRETRRRARVEKLPTYLKLCLQQIALTRDALRANPNAGKAVYHALMTGMLSRYPDTADVMARTLEKRENAAETILNPQRRRPILNKVAGR